MRVLDTRPAIPADERELSAVLAGNAQSARFKAERRFSITLTFDQTGVKVLSRLLLDLREAMQPNRLVRLLGAKVSFQSSLLVTNSLSAFLAKRCEGALAENGVVFNSQKFVTLYFDDHNWVLPTYKAGKEFIHGGEDDISFFYETIVEKRSLGGMKLFLTVSSAGTQDPDDGRKLTEKPNARSAEELPNSLSQLLQRDIFILSFHMAAPESPFCCKISC
jgi:hypothetical protein